MKKPLDAEHCTSVVRRVAKPVGGAKDQYLSLLRKLDAMIAQGTDDSPEGDALRDQMDEPWCALTEAERVEVVNTLLPISTPTLPRK